MDQVEANVRDHIHGVDGVAEGGVPAGSVMLFHQDAAPTGWTKDTAATLNNSALRVVTSTAWASGKQGATEFTTVFGSGLGTGGLTLSESHMPSHTHATQFREDSNAGGNVPYSSASSTGGALVDTDATGGGTSHNHTLSLDLNYINMIIASKD